MDQSESGGWRPSANADVLRQRAQIYRQLREFFYLKNILEVETPILSRYGNTDPHIESFKALPNVMTKRSDEGNAPCYLHTSPEFAMKRLLAANGESIYQICKVFRHDEFGRYHNPEFSMLEWYRVGFSYQELMDEVADLVLTLQQTFYGKDQTISVEKMTYQQAFITTTGLNPQSSSTQELSDYVLAQQHSVQGLTSDDRDSWLDLIMGQFVQPQLGLGKLSFVYAFPATKSALANVRQGSPALAERFELFVEGVELANGYQELTDAQKILNVFETENEKRSHNNQHPVNYDKYLIMACEQGLPSCAGVAMGLDRLILLILKQKSLKNVLAFCYKNA